MRILERDVLLANPKLIGFESVSSADSAFEVVGGYFNHSSDFRIWWCDILDRMVLDRMDLLYSDHESELWLSSN
jgi:hypothetical protein